MNKEEFKQNIEDTVDTVMEMLWNMGIDVKELYVKDSKEYLFKGNTLGGYPSEIRTIKAPPSYVYENDFGVVKIIKEKVNETN